MAHYELSIEMKGSPTRKRFCVDADEAPAGGDTLTYTEGGTSKQVALPNGVAVTIVENCTNWGTGATLTKA